MYCLAVTRVYDSPEFRSWLATSRRVISKLQEISPDHDTLEIMIGELTGLRPAFTPPQEENQPRVRRNV